jgi:hypothetical protein
MIESHNGKVVMPDLEICSICNMSIKPDDLSVIVPPDLEETQGFGDIVYEKRAHASCYDQVRDTLNKS